MSWMTVSSPVATENAHTDSDKDMVRVSSSSRSSHTAPGKVCWSWPMRDTKATGAFSVRAASRANRSKVSSDRPSATPVRSSTASRAPSPRAGTSEGRSIDGPHCVLRVIGGSPA